MNHIFLFAVTRNINFIFSTQIVLIPQKKSRSNSFIISIIFFSLLQILNTFFLLSPPPSRSAASFPEGARPHAAEGYSKEQEIDSMALIGIIRLFSPHDTINSAVRVKGAFIKLTKMQKRAADGMNIGVSTGMLNGQV